MGTNASVALAGVTDFVYDEGRHQLYALTSGGGLYTWSPTTGDFRQWAAFSNSPTSIDIAPNGAFVLIGHGAVSTSGDPSAPTSQAMMRRFWLDTGAVEQIDLTVTGAERGFVDVAITSTNVALATTDYGGSGWTPFHTFSATTPHASQIGPDTVQGLSSVTGGSYLVPSTNNQYVLVLEDNISNAPIHIYDASAGRIISSNNLYNIGDSGFNTGKADISDARHLVVNTTYNTAIVYDFSLNVVKNLSNLTGAGVIVGAHFSAGGEKLFLWDSNLDQILVYDTTSWAKVGSLAVQANVSSAYNGAPWGHMTLAENGRFLILSTGSGFEAIDLSGLVTTTPPPPPPPPSPVGISRTGGEGPDQLIGGSANDTLSGAGGDDTLQGGRGDDRLDGGAGVDTADYFNAAGAVTVNLSSTTQALGSDGQDTLLGIENIFGSPYGDTLSGDGQANFILGWAGGDYVSGFSGDDTLLGGAGDDVLGGGDGADRLEGGPGRDLLTGGLGADIFWFGTGHSGVAQVGADVVMDFFDADRLSFGSLSGGGYVERTALTYDDALTTANSLISTGAARFVAVKLNADVLMFADTAGDLGVAEDVVILSGRTLNDVSEASVVGSQGVNPPPPPAQPGSSSTGTPQADTMQGGLGDDERFGGDGNDTITDLGGRNYLRGDDGDDSIGGGASFDDINGNRGNDTASGGDGEDWVVGGKDHDLLSGDGGDDIVYGNIGQDTCLGGDGDDIVRGGQDGDSLSGGAGADWLSGDRGDDFIAGGSGADMFHTFGEAGIDRILDFNRAEGDRVMVTGGATYAVSQVGADTVISMAGGGQMILTGVSMSSLSGTWIFAV